LGGFNKKSGRQKEVGGDDDDGRRIKYNRKIQIKRI
jgi:hypothetical protein